MAERVVAYIGIGSNLRPESRIPQALDLLGHQVEITGISTFYRTDPIGRPEQPVYLNGACRIETAKDPRSLKFKVLRPIEDQLGRKRTADKYAARAIDLDILLYGDETYGEPDLRIPDPDIRTRPFVAVPLFELVPEAVLPDTGEALADLPAARAEGLRPDAEFTRMLRMRLDHESRTR